MRSTRSSIWSGRAISMPMPSPLSSSRKSVSFVSFATRIGSAVGRRMRRKRTRTKRMRGTLFQNTRKRMSFVSFTPPAAIFLKNLTLPLPSAPPSLSQGRGTSRPHLSLSLGRGKGPARRSRVGRVRFFLPRTREKSAFRESFVSFARMSRPMTPAPIRPSTRKPADPGSGTGRATANTIPICRPRRISGAISTGASDRKAIGACSASRNSSARRNATPQRPLPPHDHARTPPPHPSP